MVNPVTSSALSGLNAASKHVEAASNNISNYLTVGKPDSTNPAEQAYQAQTVQQSTNGVGGAKAGIVERDPPTKTAFNPGSPLSNSNGLVEAPNVDLGEELINLITAENSYEANAAVLRSDEKLVREVLDIVT